MKISRTSVLLSLIVLSLLAVVMIQPFTVFGDDVVTDTIPVGDGPYAIAVNPTHHKAFVANYWDYRVSVINTASDTLKAQVPVSDPAIDPYPFPLSVAVNPNTDKVYVVNWAKADLVVMNGNNNTVEASIPVGSFHRPPRAVVVDPTTNKVYVANYGWGDVYVIDGDPVSPTYNTIVATINVNTKGVYQPQTRVIAVNPTLKRVYAANGYGNNLVVIDVDPASANYNKKIADITTGAGPRAITINPDNGKVYVANITGNNVTVLNGLTNTVEATISVGTNPRAIDINTITNKIYVANYGSGNVTIIDGATNIVRATVNSGPNPRAIAVVNRLAGNAYVANANSGSDDPSTVTIIDPDDTVMASLGVGVYPISLGIDLLFKNPKVYVANWVSNDITVIDPSPGNDSPLTTTIDPFPGDTTPELTPMFTGTAVNQRAPINSNVTKVVYQIDSEDGEWVSAAITGGASSPSVTWQATALKQLEPGPHTINVAALDATSGTICSSDGNISNSMFTGGITTYSFTVGMTDTTPPDPPVILSPQDGTSTDDPVAISGTAETLSSVDIFDNGDKITTCSAGPDGSWNAGVWAFEEGPHSIVATATDEAGNRSAESEPADVMVRYATALSFTCDTLKPVGGMVHVSGRLTCLSSGIGVDGRTVTVTLGAQTMNIVTDGTGLAEAYIPVTQQQGIYMAYASFNGEANYKPSGSQGQFVVIYDPFSGQKVTGGGWILNGSGKCNFGFNAEYKSGASIPAGQVQYVDHLNGLNVHSGLLTYLVFIGNKAILYGDCTVNGMSGYGFELAVTDVTEAGQGTDGLGITITGPDGSLFYSAQETLQKGNIKIM